MIHHMSRAPWVIDSACRGQYPLRRSEEHCMDDGTGPTHLDQGVDASYEGADDADLSVEISSVEELLSQVEEGFSITKGYIGCPLFGTFVKLSNCEVCTFVRREPIGYNGRPEPVYDGTCGRRHARDDQG